MADFTLNSVVLEKIRKAEVENELKLKHLRSIRDAVHEDTRCPQYNLTERLDESADNIAEIRRKAHKRNTSLLKELNIETAKLRSWTCYSPTELHLWKLRKIYDDDITAKFKRRRMKTS